MLPIRTILHPTDFSANSHYAWELACALARDYGARLLLIHVEVPVPVFAELGAIPPQPVDRRALEAELAQIKPHRLRSRGLPIFAVRGRTRRDQPICQTEQC